MTPPAPSPGGSIAQLAADFLTQLSGGLIITPATISSQAAVPALQRLISTPDAQLATLLPTIRVTRFDKLRLFATSSLDIALRSPSSRPPIVAAPATGCRALAVIEHPRHCRPGLGRAAGPRRRVARV